MRNCSAERRDDLPTTHFADMPALVLDRADRPLGPSLLRTRWRQAEQFWSNQVVERVGVTATALKFQIGARTLASIQRQLARVSVDLIDAMSGRLPSLPPLPRDSHGYFITSLAEPRLEDIVRTVPEMLPHVRQRYARCHTDLTLGFADYWGRLSSNTRSQLKRKGRRVAEALGRQRAGSNAIARPTRSRVSTTSPAAFRRAPIRKS